MPHRVWNEERNEWVILSETINKALNVEVYDGKGYYRDPKKDEYGNIIEGEFSDKFLSVEECLEKVGDKINSGDIGAIGNIKHKIESLEDRVDYIEENGGGGGGGGGSSW